MSALEDPALAGWVAPLGPAFATRFRLEGLLGLGASGAVLQARDLELDRRVAIKLVELDASPHAQAAARFQEEGRVLAALRHPAIVPLLDHGTQGGIGYLVYPDEGGLDLGRWLRTGGLADTEAGRLAPAAALPILRGILEGLAAAHAAGVLHRDLKPGNVLVLPDRQVQLIDFGLALRSGRTRLTVTQGLVGTPAYLSPQRVQGAEATPADDLYALGVLAYELLSGTNPFRAEDLAAVLNLQLSRRPPPLATLVPACPPALAAWVDRLLEKEPEARPASASAAARLLDAPAFDARATVDPAGPLPAPVRASRLPALAGLVALVVAFLLPPSPTPQPQDPHSIPVPGFDPASWPRRLEADLDSLSRSSEGRIVPPDPLDWPHLPELLPSLSQLQAHLAAGGTLDAVLPEDRPLWLDLSRRFTGLGLPSPVEPYLSLRSGLPGGADEAAGWMATALVELQELKAGHRQVSTAMVSFMKGEGPGPEDESLASWLRLSASLGLVLTDQDPLDLVAGRLVLAPAAARAAQGRWLAPLGARAAAVAYALGRATRQAGTAGDSAVVAGLAWLGDLRGFLLPVDLAHGSRALFGGTPRTPAGSLLAGAWSDQRSQILGRRIDSTVKRGPDGTIELLLDALEGTETTAPAVGRRDLALEALGRRVRGEGFEATLPRVFGVVLDRLSAGDADPTSGLVRLVTRALEDPHRHRPDPPKEWPRIRAGLLETVRVRNPTWAAAMAWRF